MIHVYWNACWLIGSFLNIRITYFLSYKNRSLGCILLGVKPHRNITQNTYFLAWDLQIRSVGVKGARKLGARQNIASGSEEQGQNPTRREGKGTTLVPRLMRVCLAVGSLARTKASRSKRGKRLWGQNTKGAKIYSLAPVLLAPLGRDVQLYFLWGNSCEKCSLFISSNGQTTKEF